MKIKGVWLIFVSTIVVFTIACGERKAPVVVQTKDSLANSEAIRGLSKSIEQDADNAELYYQRATAYMNLKLLDRALADINDAIRFDDANPLYPFQKGRICYAMNKTIEAEQAYRSAITLKPDYTVAQMKLAELYYIVKKHRESIDLLNSVTAAEPGKADAYFFKGMNYKETGDTGKSISNFQKALEYDAAYYDAAIQLGRLFAARKQREAIAYLEAAIRMQKRNPEAYFVKAYYHQQVGDYQRALNDYRKVIDIDPSNDLAYYNVGVINYDVNQLREAMRAFNICIQMNNQQVPAYYMRGLVHERQGEKEEAQRNYAYALELDPDYAPAKERIRK